MKIFFTSILFLLSTSVIFAQKLTITEVDAPNTGYFNKASFKTLGKEMQLNLSGSTLSVKVENDHEIILKQCGSNCFKAEQKNGEKTTTYFVKLKTDNSIITTANLTRTVSSINQRSNKLWYTVTAKNTNSPAVLSSL